MLIKSTPGAGRERKKEEKTGANRNIQI